jgi:hypothetical protein
VQGKIVIPPFRVNGETLAKDFASSLRKDLRTELARSTQLDVALADGSP